MSALDALPPAVTDVETWPQMLAGLTLTYRAAEKAYHDQRDRWQEAMTAAVDAGYPVATVGSWVGVSTARVHTILARQYGIQQERHGAAA